MFNVQHHSARLGYTPAEARAVTPVPSWVLALVPRPANATQHIKHNEQVERDTIPLIKKIVRETLSQTSKLAAKLKGTSLEETVKNDTNFILKHIRYKRDASGKEQVREPARLIYEGAGDCDCFATLLSSLLTNQKIPHSFRIMKQNGASEWSHIYVIVPKPGGGYYTLDPVTNQFNTEPKFTAKKDIPMALERLSGLGETEQHTPLRCLFNNNLKNLAYYVPTKQVLSANLVPTREFLLDENIAFVDDGDKVNVQTSEGIIAIPSVITPEQAAALKQDKAAVTQQATAPAAKQAGGFGWLFALLFGGAVLSSLSGPAKKPAGLSGVKAANQKRKFKTLQL